MFGKFMLASHVYAARARDSGLYPSSVETKRASAVDVFFELETHAPEASGDRDSGCKSRWVWARRGAGSRRHLVMGI